jgi:hypothetical protein
LLRFPWNFERGRVWGEGGRRRGAYVEMSRTSEEKDEEELRRREE